jgi:hypothetical protein
MRDNSAVENGNYKYIDGVTIKKMSDQNLLDKVNNTNRFLKLCEIYLKDVKDDYSKQKIASLRVEFVRHQLDILVKECFARGIKNDLTSYY